MPEPNHRHPPTVDQDAITEAVLAILLEHHPALLAVEEMVAELFGPDSPVPMTMIDQAIDELERLGLAHSIDRFVFASYRAVRARQLGAG